MSTLLEIRGQKVRPAHLHTLPIGTAFLLPDVSSGGFVVGSLLKVTPGYAKVSIVGEESEVFVPDKKKGGLRPFIATQSYETEWSRGTMVYPVPDSSVGSGIPESESPPSGSLPASPPATFLPIPGRAASRGKAEVTKPGHHKEVRMSDSVSVKLDPKGQPIRPKGGVLKPSNAVKEEVTISVKEKIMAKIEKSKEKAAAKGAGNLKPKEKKEKTPKVPTNICPGSGELVFRKFKPGMDARYYGWLKKIVRGQMKTTELPDYTRKFLAKVDSSITRAIEKELTEHGVDVAALKEEAATE